MQSNDERFKAELGKLVELDVWEQAKAESSKQLKAKSSQRTATQMEQNVRLQYAHNLDTQVTTSFQTSLMNSSALNGTATVVLHACSWACKECNILTLRAVSGLHLLVHLLTSCRQQDWGCLSVTHCLAKHRSAPLARVRMQIGHAKAVTGSRSW